MVQNNKVLTVSYGTFSCTLEGFEDSFGTMQAIAEYFRDLAADDRYFGAEPPQPDAQMLAQIAQREVTRQVEARTSSEGIHLRAASPAAVPAEPVANDTIEAAPLSTKAETPDAPVEDAEIEAEATPVEDSAEDLDLSTVDFFEDTDMQEEAATSDLSETSDAENDVQAAGAVEEQPAPTASPSVDMATIAAISAAVGEPAAEEAAGEEEEVAGAVEFFADTEEEAAEAEEPVAAPAKEPSARKPSADSIAAKLQRIRAVVAHTPEEEFSEDEHAESFVETVRAELIQEEDQADTAEASTEIEEAEDEISRVLDRLDLSGQLAASGNEAEADSAADDHDEGEDSLFGDIAKAIVADPVAEEAEADDSRSQVDQARAEAEDMQPRPRRSIRVTRRQDPAEQPIAPQAEEVEPSTAEAPPVDEPADAAAEATAPQLRARIVKIKRSELEKAMANGQLEKVEEDDTEEEQVTSSASSLNADEEADLLRELAEVEADLLASTQDLDAPEPETDAPKVANESEEAALPEQRSAVASPDSDVSRLMAAAESKLGDPDNAKSRETYSHLRAAVAAAEADPSAKGSDSADAEPYREALASVVRPRRPEAGSANKAPRPRNTGLRPAPLKLVAAQRVDSTPAAEPVRPRRVSALEEEPAPLPAEAGSFADYAQERGAVELQELLEAAASYLSFVEGRDHFSRPQLMNKVRGLEGTDFNREDGLRFFGQLLREGKIERSENGRFAATDDIGFRPPNRAAS